MNELYVGLKIKDYQVIKLLSKSKILIKCTQCDSERIVLLHSFLRQKNEHSDICGLNYYTKKIGTIYGDLELIDLQGFKEGRPFYIVKCQLCGLQRIMDYRDIKKLKSVYHKSCQSVQVLMLNDRTPMFISFYAKWNSIRSRTTNIKDSHYKYYGGRGISSDYYAEFKTFYDDQYGNYLEACKKFSCPSIERIIS